MTNTTPARQCGTGKRRRKKARKQSTAQNRTVESKRTGIDGKRKPPPRLHIGAVNERWPDWLIQQAARAKKAAA